MSGKKRDIISIRMRQIVLKKKKKRKPTWICLEHGLFELQTKVYEQMFWTKSILFFNM